MTMELYFFITTPVDVTQLLVAILDFRQLIKTNLRQNLRPSECVCVASLCGNPAGQYLTPQDLRSLSN